MPEVATPNQAEREFETGTDESFKNTSSAGSAAHAENQRVTFANIKRTYDVYQDLDIQAARQAHIEQTRLNQIASQALQNAVETANMVAKRSIELNNLAHDSFWNPVASGAGMNLTAGAAPANRVVDSTGAVAGGSVNADIAAITAAVAKSVDASILPVLSAVEQAVQALASSVASITSALESVRAK